MEEMARDHGIDRLLIFFILFFPQLSFATTFGPIDVSHQIRDSQYFLHGKIIEGPWAEMERDLGRPYTHWRLQITEQFTGTSLGTEVIIRQPGGEINGMGYAVAGSAKFSGGEDVFVNVRDTHDPKVKEVVGLASGKYKVTNTGGAQKIQNGIGFPVQVSGKNLSSDEFAQLARRLAKGTETGTEKKIILNSHFEQDHDPVLENQINEALELKKQAISQGKIPKETEANQSPKNKEDIHQEASPASEESNDSGSWKLPVIFALFAFAVGVIFILRRK